MHRFRHGILVFLALVAAVAPARADDSAATPPALRPVAPLAWLVGGTWTADCTKLGGGMKAIETRYRWSDNDAYVRFTTHFISDKGTLKNYDGNFFWDPADAALHVWYTDARNEITQGAVAVQGDTMEIAFRAHDFAGKLADMKVAVVRSTNDRYTWSLSEKNGDAWKPLFSLEYIRTPGA
ncbi:MAG TPA: hypothetical protein VFL12_09360 [Thermoanaerobaculia bacterium]|nr:hypothetical protein [Thermoanaerobaculia bacterium]